MGSSRKIGGVFWRSLGYLAGQAGLMAFSFITFPLFTRLLSKGDYGLLSLTNTTLSMAGLVVGLGLPNAVVRFAPEYSSETVGDRGLRFNTTMLAGSTGIAALGAILLVAVSSILNLPRDFQALAQTFQYVAVVLVARAAMNIVLEFFRVARNVSGYNLICFIQKINNVGFSILGYAVFRTLKGLLLGMAAGESAALLIGLGVAWRCDYWKRVPVIAGDFWKSVAFASPMMLGGVCASFMNFGDRYFLQGYRGPEELAGYVVAYDLCLYLQVLLTTSFRLSALPEIVSRYTAGGDAEAAKFLSKAFQYFSWLLIGVGFGSIAVGRQALTILASSKYADAGNLLPYLVPGILIGGLGFLFASGLYLKNRTGVWFGINAVFAAANFGLNFLLIPKLGAKGAAIATLLTYLGQTAAIILVSGRFLSVRFAGFSLLRTTGCGLVMFLAISWLSAGPRWIDNMPVKVILGVLVYGVLLVILEKQARQLVRSIWSGRRYAN